LASGVFALFRIKLDALFLGKLPTPFPAAAHQELAKGAGSSVLPGVNELLEEKNARRFSK
jgi:hypothetical protein